MENNPNSKPSIINPTQPSLVLYHDTFTSVLEIIRTYHDRNVYFIFPCYTDILFFKKKIQQISNASSFVELCHFVVEEITANLTDKTIISMPDEKAHDYRYFFISVEIFIVNKHIFDKDTVVFVNTDQYGLDLLFSDFIGEVTSSENQSDKLLREGFSIIHNKTLEDNEIILSEHRAQLDFHKNIYWIKKNYDKSFLFASNLFYQNTLEIFIKKNASILFINSNLTKLENKKDDYKYIFLTDSTHISSNKFNTDLLISEHEFNEKTFDFEEMLRISLEITKNILTDLLFNKILIVALNTEEAAFYYEYLKIFKQIEVFRSDELFTSNLSEIHLPEKAIIISFPGMTQMVYDLKIDTVIIPRLPSMHDCNKADELKIDRILSDPESIEFFKTSELTGIDLIHSLEIMSKKNPTDILLSRTFNILEYNNVKTILLCCPDNIPTENSSFETKRNLINRLTERVSNVKITKIKESHSEVQDKIFHELIPDKYAKFSSKLYKYYLKNIFKSSDFRTFLDTRENFPESDFLISKNGRTTQEDIIHYILRSFFKETSDIDSFVIAATGMGKSLLYQLPAVILSESFEPKLSIIISPLLSLMKDQTDFLKSKGIFNATHINSTVPNDIKTIRYKLIEKGHYNIVFAAPETIVNTESFKKMLGKRKVAFLVVDEAHCVSQWGHDFRIDYFRLRDSISRVYGKRDFPLAAFTATAKHSKEKDISAINDIIRVLGLDIAPEKSIVSSTVRTNLFYDVIVFNNGNVNDEELDGCKCDFLVSFFNDPLMHLSNRGIDTRDFSPSMRNKFKTLIYCSSVRTTHKLSEFLNSRTNYSFKPYNARLTPEERDETQNSFKSGEALDGICATTAFGMGIDISDIRIVINFDPSQSVESYYQEAGRAGRDMKTAYCLLMYQKALSRRKSSAKAMSDIDKVTFIQEHDRIDIQDFILLKNYLSGKLKFENKSGNKISESVDRLNSLFYQTDEPGTKVPNLMFYLSDHYSPESHFLKYKTCSYKLRFKIIQQDVTSIVLSGNHDYDRMMLLFHKYLVDYRDIHHNGKSDYITINLNDHIKSITEKTGLSYRSINEALYFFSKTGLIRIESNSNFNPVKGANPDRIKIIGENFLSSIGTILKIEDSNTFYMDFSKAIQQSNYFLKFNSSGQIMENLFSSILHNSKIHEFKKVKSKNRFPRFYITSESLKQVQLIQEEITDYSKKIFSYLSSLLDFIKLKEYPERTCFYDLWGDIFHGNVSLKKSIYLLKPSLSALYQMGLITYYSPADISSVFKIKINDKETFKDSQIIEIYRYIDNIYNYRKMSLKLMLESYIDRQDFSFTDRRNFFEDYFLSSEYDEKLLTNEKPLWLQDLKETKYMLTIEQTITENPFKAIKLVKELTDKSIENKIERNIKPGTGHYFKGVNGSFNSGDFGVFFKALNDFIEIPTKEDKYISIITYSNKSRDFFRDLVYKYKDNKIPRYGVHTFSGIVTLILNETADMTGFESSRRQKVPVNYIESVGGGTEFSNLMNIEFKSIFKKYFPETIPENIPNVLSIDNKKIVIYSNILSGNVLDKKIVFSENFRNMLFESYNRIRIDISKASFEFERFLFHYLLEKIWFDLSKTPELMDIFEGRVINRFKIIFFDEKLSIITSKWIGLLRLMNPTAVIIKIDEKSHEKKFGFGLSEKTILDFFMRENFISRDYNKLNALEEAYDLFLSKTFYCEKCLNYSLCKGLQ